MSAGRTHVQESHLQPLRVYSPDVVHAVERNAAFASIPHPCIFQVLARWGGMGHHRYQVGFSGDVAGLTWDNLAYQV